MSFSFAQRKLDSIYTQQVVFTGSHKELKKEDLAIPVQIYDASYFERQQITNVQDAVRMITGIQMNVDGALDGSGDIEFNGQEGSYTLVMIDGVPVSGGNATVYAISGIPMCIVERIEVIFGPASTIYGTDAVAGVINVITKSAEISPLVYGNVSINTLLESSIDVALKLKAGKLDGLLSVSNFNMPQKWDFNKDGYMDIPLQNRLSIFNKWTYRNKVQKLSSIWLRYTNDRRSGGEMDWSRKYSGSDYIYGEDIVNNRFEGAGNFAMPTVGFDLNLSTAYLHQEQRTFYGIVPYNTREQNFFSQFLFSKKIAKEHELTAGLAYRLYRFEQRKLQTTDTFFSQSNLFTNHIPALFVQDMSYFGTNHSLLAGVRFEYTSINKSFAISPRIDYRFLSTSKTHALRIGIGSGFRAPNLFIDDRLSYTKGKKLRFDYNIKNELSYGGHIHYEFKKNLGDIYLRFDSRIFASGILNQVEAEQDEDDENLFVFENEEETAMYTGWQTNVDIKFPKHFYIQLGYTLQWAFKIEDKNEISEIVNAPKYNMTFDIGYQNIEKGWTASFNGWLNSPMLLRRQLNDTRAEYSPWFSWLNVYVEKKWKNGIALRIGANNILNMRPSDVVFRGEDPFNYRANDNVSNPNGWQFDTTYIYAPNKGVHGFFSILYTLNSIL